jgi:hypothetical protein
MNRNNRNDNRNRRPDQDWNQNQENFRNQPNENDYRRGHSRYRNEGDFGNQNSVSSYGNYGNMGSYGGAQGYGEHNAWAQQQRGYFNRPYGDEGYEQQNQRSYNRQNWQQNDSPYGDWRENAGYYAQNRPQNQQRNYYGNQHQGQWENMGSQNQTNYSHRGRSYGPGNTSGGAYMGSGYSRISEGEYGPMLGDEGSETAFSRLNGGYSSRGGIAHPGNTFNSITKSFWDDDTDIDYGATFGDDIEYNPYERPGQRRRNAEQSENRRRNSGRNR